MAGFRFSLLALAGFVGAAAVACLALRQASMLTVVATWSLAICVLSYVTLGALLAGSRGRGFRVGFAFCGWLYFALLWGPFVQVRDTLATTHILSFAAQTLRPENLSDSEYSQQMRRRAAFFDSLRGPNTSPGVRIEYFDPSIPGDTVTTSRTVTRFVESFFSTGEALFTLLLATIGGLAGAWLHAKDQSRELHSRREA